eukprot:TRINITY_DN20323_c0_g2_i1.p1 TRINITY_DN20323_c0_g2~~TRINITY_DN20323_c0_g2_i1.p1  ORF type:complete len:1236 (+),score=163.37 TRINITY_DN20323_c0_g2_i1:57-3764(+)
MYKVCVFGFVLLWSAPQEASSHGSVIEPMSKNELAYTLRGYGRFPKGMPSDFRYEPWTANYGNMRGQTGSDGGSSCGAKNSLNTEGLLLWEQFYIDSGIAVPTLTPGAEVVVRARITADHGGQAWLMVACGNKISEDVEWTFLDRASDDRDHHFLPSNPAIYAWAVGEAMETMSKITTSRWQVPSSFKCSSDHAIGRWLWKTGNTCNDVNNIGRSTESFSLEEFTSIVRDYNPSKTTSRACTVEPEIFISCFDFRVSGTSGPPVSAPSMSPTPSTTASQPTSRVTPTPTPRIATATPTPTPGSPTSTPAQTPTPTPGSPSSTPTSTETSECTHNDDCTSSAWCQQTSLVQWCAQMGVAGSCPTPHCRRGGGSQSSQPKPSTPACVHQTDCGLSAWCENTGFDAWCGAQGSAGACPSPQCKRLVGEQTTTAPSPHTPATPGAQTTTAPTLYPTTALTRWSFTTSDPPRPSTSCVPHSVLVCINDASSFWPKCDPSQAKINEGPAGYEYGHYCTNEWAEALSDVLRDPVVDKCQDMDAIQKFLAQVAYETAYYSTVYQPRDGGAGLIHMIPGNWVRNALDMDALWPGNDYATKAATMGKSFFQTAAYGWRSVAAWFKRTNEVIPGCGIDLFSQSFEEQTRCILSRVVSRQEAYDIVGQCLVAPPPRPEPEPTPEPTPEPEPTTEPTLITTTMSRTTSMSTAPYGGACDPEGQDCESGETCLCCDNTDNLRSRMPDAATASPASRSCAIPWTSVAFTWTLSVLRQAVSAASNPIADNRAKCFCAPIGVNCSMNPSDPTKATTMPTSTVTATTTDTPSPIPTRAPTVLPSPPTPPPSGGDDGQVIDDAIDALKNSDSDGVFMFDTGTGWVESTVYKWADMIVAVQLMATKGVGGVKLWLGDTNHVHGLVNVAAFLAQCMQETIQYNACDENNWSDRAVASEHGGATYSATSACGQLHQSYQDYQCSAEEDELAGGKMACEVDPAMELRAHTQAGWYGAPPKMFCAPKSKLPFAPRWDYAGPWCAPPGGWGHEPPFPDDVPLDTYFEYVGSGGSCKDYNGIKAGGWKFSGEGCSGGACPGSDAPLFGVPKGRTDVEGCCWWGRGVIQTTGTCNFGKLNFYLGKRAADEGRDAIYPTIDFCRQPGQICAPDGPKELKWVAGLFYWLNAVQPYSAGGWNYMKELQRWVDAGMDTGDTSFINGASGIVNRGCHNPPNCGTGELHGGASRVANFKKILTAMGLT